MFKIESLTFFHEDDFQTYNFSSHAFVYGANTVGKTAMTKAINYVLGSSDPLSYQGLDNIDGVEAHLSNDKTDLWIKRTINGRYAYKRTINSEYTDVSAETYKDNICLITSPEIDHHFTDVYYKVIEEKPSFRSFNFLNFVEEKGLGDLSAVFTMAKELRHQIRIQKIMNFFFNYQNIEKIYEKEVELEVVESSLRSLQLDYQDYTRMLAQQKQLFTDLQLRYTGNIPKDLKTFEDFKNSFVRKKKNESKDIVYLSMARQTHLQLLVYLNMFAYLQEKFKGFVYAPILIIDSANQPMGVDSFQKVYPVLIDLADQVGIQTIFLSKDLIDSVNSDDLIDISAGLNKFHKQTRDK